MMKRAKGISLVELLIVMAIIGIVAGIGGVQLRQAVLQSRVNEAARQLSADLQKLRSSAQRFNVNASLTIPSATATSYTFTIDGKTTTRTFPPRVSLATKPSTFPLTMTYNAPYGEVSGASNVTFNFSSTANTSIKAGLKALGVTGKVYRTPGDL